MGWKQEQYNMDNCEAGWWVYGGLLHSSIYFSMYLKAVFLKS